MVVEFIHPILILGSFLMSRVVFINIYIEKQKAYYIKFYLKITFSL